MSKYSVPKNLFLQLLMMSMMYTVVISFMFLWFSYLDVLLPDGLHYYNSSSYSIMRNSAVLLVAFPVFLFVNYLIEKDAKKFPEVKESGVRKWLVYLTLFVAAVTMIVNLISLVFSFYNGDLSTLFVLKSLLLLAVTGFVFYYYLRDLSGKVKKGKFYAGGLSLLILGSLVAGFLIVGSPAHQRKMRFDSNKIYDLNNIQIAVANYWETNNVLPSSLEDLTKQGWSVEVRDFETNENYEYRVISDLTFELCAVFETEQSAKEAVFYDYSHILLANKYNWEHGVGRKCFERTINPNGYNK